MFSKLALVSSLAILAVATPTPGGGSSGGQCNTGPIQCCNSSGKAGHPAIATLLKSVGAVVQDVNVLVGVTCTPITVIGGGGNSCNAQPLCCENNNFNGVVAVGCVPVNINV